jgi:hypothetical protein
MKIFIASIYISIFLTVVCGIAQHFYFHRSVAYACAEPCAAAQAGHGNSNGSSSSSSSGHNSSYSHPHSTATFASHPGKSSR